MMISGLMAFAGWAVIAAEPPLVKDMVRFDQAYIPVLALTSENQLVPARKAFRALMGEWQRFRQAHGQDFPADEQWKEDLKEVESNLRKAGGMIDEGAHLKEAHEVLEPVRQILMRARQRAGIDYFVDHLTRFHEPMEAIVLKCKQTPAPDLSAAHIENLDEQLRLLQKLWGKVKGADFKADLFEFDDCRAATLRQNIEFEDQAIARFEKALASGDAKAVVEAGVALKPPFARCFKLFGRFPNERN